MSYESLAFTGAVSSFSFVGGGYANTAGRTQDFMVTSGSCVA